jgi:ATP-dependent DNA ligase
MPRVVKRSASQAVKVGPPRRGLSLPNFIPPQLSQLVEKPPSGPQWLYGIKLDGYRVAARIDTGRVQLLTRTGLDWTAKYPSAIVAVGNVNVKTTFSTVNFAASTLQDCRASPKRRRPQTASAT